MSGYTSWWSAPASDPVFGVCSPREPTRLTPWANTTVDSEHVFITTVIFPACCVFTNERVKCKIQISGFSLRSETSSGLEIVSLADFYLVHWCKQPVLRRLLLIRRLRIRSQQRNPNLTMRLVRRLMTWSQLRYRP